MKRIIGLRCALCARVALAVECLLFGPSAQAATPKTILIFMDERLHANGVATYALAARNFFHAGGSNGNDDFADRPHLRCYTPFAESIPFPTFAQLANEAIGNWTLNSVSNADPGDVERYNFSLGSLDLTDVTVPRPRVHCSRRRSEISHITASNIS